MATGVDMITAAVKAALGEKVTDIEQRPYDGHWAEVILHADKSGTFQGLEISQELEPYVMEKDLWVKAGDKISSFNGANDAIGTLVMKFDNLKNMHEFFKKRNSMSYSIN